MSTEVTDPRRSPAWKRALRSRWLRPLNDVDAVDQLLAQVHPLWSLRRICARVVAVIDETADTRSFVLQANGRWPGFQAGQHLLLRHEIDGAIEQRCYTLSRSPQSHGAVTITVKRQANGRISNRLCTELQRGKVVEIAGVAGEFVLPRELPARILLLSAGSGITPMRALLEALRDRGFAGKVVLVHSCRGDADFIFGAELRALASLWPALKIIAHDSTRHGRIDHHRLRQYISDFTVWPTWACGPAAMLEWLHVAFRNTATEALLRTESFGALVFDRSRGAPGEKSTVHCSTSKQVFTAGGGLPLLLEAENAGLQPRYGCRRGICRTCSCRKRSGSVENLLTGAVSSQADQWIQLCISVARSDLDLEL